LEVRPMAVLLGRQGHLLITHRLLCVLSVVPLNDK
jgi:hypothetical protein